MNKIKKALVSTVACMLACFNVVGLAACGGLRGDSSSANAGNSNSTSESGLGFNDLFGTSSSESSSSVGDSSVSESDEGTSVGDSSEDSSVADSSKDSSVADSSEDSSVADSSTGNEITTPVNDVIPYDGSEVTVTFYHTMGAQLKAILDEYIPEFNAMYPNITISHDMMGDYDALRDQITTELTAGNSPSMAYCYPDHVALYQKAKKVLTLDDYIMSDETVTLDDGTTTTMGYTQEQLNDFIPAYFEEGRAYGDGKMYTLPITKSTEVLYYNKTVFEENGWTVPTTWGEMEALCAKIKAKYPNDIPFGYDSESNWFITMTEQFGSAYTSSKKGEYFLFNNDTNRQFVEVFRTWYNKGYFTTEEIYGNYTSNLFKETDPNKPKIYMCIGSSAGATYQCPSLVKLPVYDENGVQTGEKDGYPFEVGIAMIPQVNPSNPKVIQQGPSVCLFKKSNPQEVAATWLFAKFLTTCVEYQARVSMNNGYAPVIQSAQEHPVYADFLAKADGNKYLQATAVKMTLAQKDAYYISPAFVGSSAAREKVGALLQTCLVTPLGGKTAAQLIKEQFDAAITALKYDYGA